MAVILYPSVIRKALGTNKCRSCRDPLYVAGPNPTYIACLGCNLRVEVPDGFPKNGLFNKLLQYLDLGEEPSGIEG